MQCRWLETCQIPWCVKGRFSVLTKHHKAFCRVQSHRAPALVFYFDYISKISWWLQRILLLIYYLGGGAGKLIFTHWDQNCYWIGLDWIGPGCLALCPSSTCQWGFLLFFLLLLSFHSWGSDFSLFKHCIVPLQALNYIQPQRGHDC